MLLLFNEGDYSIVSYLMALYAWDQIEIKSWFSKEERKDNLENNPRHYIIKMLFYLRLPVMKWADIEKVCQMKLLCFTKTQSSQDFIFSGLFIMTKSWYHTPDDRDRFNNILLEISNGQSCS